MEKKNKTNKKQEENQIKEEVNKKDFKGLYLMLLIFFSLFLGAIGGYYVGVFFEDPLKKTSKVEVKENEKEENKEEVITSSILEVNDYSLSVNALLYNYLNSKKDFATYLKELDNNYKLFVGGVFDSVEFSTIEDNLIKLFGSTLDVEATDYFSDATSDVATYIYDEDDKTYKYSDYGTDVITDMSNTGVYNYKLKSIEYTKDGFILNYYGLYEENLFDLGVSSYTNNDNISTIEVENLDSLFEADSSDFYIFSYVYTKVNDNYILSDFYKD